MIIDVLTGRGGLRFLLAWKLWVFSVWIGRVAWVICPAMETEMRRLMAMHDILGRMPTREEMGYD